MEIEILNQRTCICALDNILRNALLSESFRKFQCLIAYISWGGLSQIQKELEGFYDRGNRLEFIIGICDHGSDENALRYLKDRFPGARIRVFHVPINRYTFHPKLYIFSNKDKTLIIIGSNNLTLGGLAVNSEVYVKLTLDNKADIHTINGVKKIWGSYSKPTKPFKQGNLRKISEKFLLKYAKERKSKRKMKQSMVKSEINDLFPAIEIPTPEVKRPPIKRSKKSIKRKKAATDGGRLLLMEVLRETGTAGMQVQIPKKASQNFFRARSDEHQTIRVQFQSQESRPAVICHFPNNTHRINFPEIADLERPLLMEIIKQKEDSYEIRIIRAGRKFNRLILKCTNQTRTGSKRWVILKDNE